MNRIANLPKSHSFFLFGARATGKTWLLKSTLPGQNTTYIDLLQANDFDLYSRDPSRLSEYISTLPEAGEYWIVIDEVQKVPSLLDVVHIEIEAHGRSRLGVTDERPKERKVYFALTGSSARKLKRGQANLLAGRAFLNYLYPLTFRELDNKFSMNEILQWGSLPGVILEPSLETRSELLSAYVHTYLREEILAEQLARDAVPFRRFLECAAQTNGEIINFSSVGRDVGVSPNTVQTYYQILEDTLLGYRVLPYHQSIRKRQRVGPKMYLFDCGVTRTLLRQQNQSITDSTYGYGRSFEQAMFLEMYRLSSYQNKDYQISYLMTKDGLEIDFIIERPGLPLALVEVKSADKINDSHLRSLKSVKKDFPKAELFIMCKERTPRIVEGIKVLPWQECITELGL